MSDVSSIFLRDYKSDVFFIFWNLSKLIFFVITEIRLKYYIILFTYLKKNQIIFLN